MSQPAAEALEYDSAVPTAEPAPVPLAYTREPVPGLTRAALVWSVLVLAAPVVVEQLLHSLVGLVDTYLANHLVPVGGLAGAALAEAHRANASAAAGVGSVTYMLWLVGLVSAAVGTGATALIARATGAKHRGLANSVCGQSVGAALLVGVALGALMLVIAEPAASWMNLGADARPYFVEYLRILGWAMPAAIVMFVAGACLRGAGDTITPAAAMVVVDVVNLFATFGLARGWFGLPELGFTGIAVGTAIAYAVGGALLVGVLVRGKGGIRLHWHRLRPHWATMRRVLCVGLPSGVEGMLQWAANFGVLYAVNGGGEVAAAAHVNTIRIEAFSYLTGMAFGTAAATLVGQALGAGDVARARASAWASYALGGGVMTLLGLSFIFLNHQWAALIADNPEVRALTAECLRVCGFVQWAFAAAIVFGSALRGAGDTLAVMLTNVASVFVVRLGLVYVAWAVWGLGLTAIWVVLSGELTLRAALMVARFKRGAWERARV